MIALHAEPNGNNPPKLIGWYDARVARPDEPPITQRLFTVNYTPSDPIILMSGHHTSARPNKSHGDRLRAAERLGYTVVSDG